MKVLDEKCLNCGATISFNPKKNKFICEYCRGEFTIGDIEASKKNKKVINLEKEFNYMEDMEGYHCNNCGASIISLDNIASTSCIYCKSNAIIKNRLTGIYKPDSIITFKYKKEDAIEAFLKICQKRLLMPKGFNDAKNISEMEGLYVPFWLYNLNNEAYVNANGTKISTWSDSNYIYTKTDYYLVERGGNLVFKNVINDASSRFDDTIMNAIEPFNYNDLVEFKTSYLAGFLSEKYDVLKDLALENLKERIENDSINYLKSQMYGYNSVIVKKRQNNIIVSDSKYVLLPVFVLNIKYQEKIYHFAMNGQTGKIVGEIPVDKKKLVLLIIITFILSTFLMIIIFLLLGYRW